jgi:hypothetical protein
LNEKQGVAVKIRVYIATTQQPVEIERITAEESEIPSSFCYRGFAQQMAVSSQYDLFVRRNGGVIAKRVGHDSFRVDLSDEISGGDSWELAMVIAHDLKKCGMLAEKGDAADMAVWATGHFKPLEGRVSERASEIGKIGGLIKKLQNSDELFNTLIAANTPVLAFYPGIQSDELRGFTASFLSHVELHGVDLIEQALGKLSLPAATPSANGTATLSISHKPRWSKWIASVVGGVALAGAGWWYQSNTQANINPSTPTAAPVAVAEASPQVDRQVMVPALQRETLVIQAVRSTSRQGDCRPDSATTQLLLTPNDGDRLEVDIEGLCELRYRYPQQAGVTLAGLVAVPRVDTEQASPIAIQEVVSNDGYQEWRMQPPVLKFSDYLVSFILIAGADSAGVRAQAKELETTASTATAGAQQLRESGVVVMRIEQLLTPGY